MTKPTEQSRLERNVGEVTLKLCGDRVAIYRGNTAARSVPCVNWQDWLLAAAVQMEVPGEVLAEINELRANKGRKKA